VVGLENQQFADNITELNSGNLKNSLSNITTTFMVVVMLFFVFSCTSEKHEEVEAITDRATFPRMRAFDVTTVISDSGITRYRLSTPQWDIYDKSEQPYWEFPKGIHLERFNLSYKVDVNLNSDYAKFLEHEQLWELKGNVKGTNILGELFETEQLFWNQREEKFYSDSMINITQTTRIIKGMGFDSNQSMTKYNIRESQAVFPFEEK